MHTCLRVYMYILAIVKNKMEAILEHSHACVNCIEMVIG